ncbi:tetratricopeptide repeat-containing sulfotransferase family protein [Caenimonas sp. SL110]|uniref:tetratricopeptide repeat-containing sulfotransferase family protein n=1 Tax=Caenimonas sp. SL110 TaxID=1450524 RepID=UPI0006547C91|nr:tetratricopeptide repeat-containing sulfotransferase family protein [Caenimonas sp. SL110]
MDYLASSCDNLRTRALAHHEAGRFADAARDYQCLLDQWPGDAAALHLFGLLHQQCGYPQRALELIGAAIAQCPQIAAFHSNLAEAHRALGQFSLAAECCREALRLAPQDPDAANNLGLALHGLGRFDEALEQFDIALAQRPGFALAQNNRGTSLVQLGRMREAESAYRRAIETAPGLAMAHSNLARLLQLDGQLDTAVPHAERAARLEPGHAGLQQHAATLHALRDDWASAIPFCERRVALAPGDVDALCDLGFAYQSGERTALAQTTLQRALDVAPGHLQACLNLADLHEQQGALDTAHACYRKAQASHPQSLLPAARRAQLAAHSTSDAERDHLRFALNQHALAPNERACTLFALAQVADARGDYAEVAACLAQANALTRGLRRASGQHYDPEEHTRYVDWLMAAFTPQLFARLGAVGDDSSQPVFVFGMPRSGTTLVEQILSSHSRIHGAGELTLVRRAMDSLQVPARETGEQLPDLASLEAAEVRRLAAGYLGGLREVLEQQGITRTLRAESPTATRIVDKMPDNYLYLGMIALMFPRATLIHVRRDLRDVAVSCWQTPFRSMRWADDMHDLAHRIGNYQRLSEHWLAVLPGRVHEVHYERLVGDFEPQARRLVVACGLEWEPACLAFHQNSRPVRTASLAQVRQPLYARSLARWHRYEPYLGSLFEGLPREPAN